MTALLVVLAIVYAVIAALVFLVGFGLWILNIYDERELNISDEEEKKTAAIIATSAPVWPVLFVRLVKQMVGDAK